MKKSTSNGPYQKSVLANGITLVTEMMPHVRSACMGLWVPAGSRHETPEQNGISHFVEHMFFKGTEKRSALDIAVAVESLGGEINAFTSREHTTYYVKVLDEHFGVAVDILADIFLHSLFDEKELEKERQVILEEIRMQEDQPEDHVHDLNQEVIWPGQPLGFPVAGRKESISSLSRADLLQYVRKMYQSPGVVVACAGNIRHDECVAAMQKGFQEFSTENRPVTVSPPSYHADTLVVTKDLEQVHLCMSLPGVAQNDPDRYAFYLLNTILGANMSSRLFQEVREKRGMAYSIYSYLSSYLDAGSLTVYTGAGKEKIEQVMRIVWNELSGLARAPVSDSELTKAKEYMKGGLMLSLESSSSVMTRIAKQEIYFGEYQPVSAIVEEIQKVTPEKIRELASKNFRKDRLSRAAIGPIDREELIR